MLIMATMLASVVHYGTHPDQTADLYLPQNARAPVVVLLHGGFWRMPYGRDQLDRAAQALTASGYAVWNMGYRRVGADGVILQDTLDDVSQGIEYLWQLDGERADIDLDRVILVGHSAGGQLALWAAAQAKVREMEPPNVRIRAVVGLAAVSDLVEASRLGLGKGAAEHWIGATPEQAPDRYRHASPRARLPIGTPTHLLHGSDDSAVPLAMSKDFIAAARTAGDDAELHELPGTGHMEFLDPESAAFAALLASLSRLSE